MKLKVKNYKWLAGKPIVVLHPEAAKKLNVFQNERVLLSNSHKFYCTVDLFPKLVKEDEIGFSNEVAKIFRLKDNEMIDVSGAPLSPAGSIIKKKLKGERLHEDEVYTIINQIVKNNITESEIAYFAAAQMFHGMNTSETVFLTKAMADTGGKIRFKEKNVVDKHCVGGVAGNRTTPLVVSICAAAGLIIPKTSSRAITSAAGTADVIETMMDVELTIDDLKKIIKKTNGCLAWGGSLGLAPSDDKIIKVERFINLDIESQMVASIMSKKIAAGAKYLVIDIPYGKGSKIETKLRAKQLGKNFRKISDYFDIEVAIHLSDGRMPVGNGIGPVFEMLDVLSVLKGTPNCPLDLKKKAITISTKIMKLAGVKDAKKKARNILESGAALEKFKEIANAQSKKEDFEKKEKALKPARYSITVKASGRGKITNIDNSHINMICRILGSPTTPSSGVYLHKKKGIIKEKEALLTMFSESKEKLKRAKEYFKKEDVVKIRF